MLDMLRALALAYSAREPDEFRVAEQFGIEELPPMLFRRPRSAWRFGFWLRRSA